MVKEKIAFNSSLENCVKKKKKFISNYPKESVNKTNTNNMIFSYQ